MRARERSLLTIAGVVSETAMCLKKIVEMHFELPLWDLDPLLSEAPCAFMPVVAGIRCQTSGDAK